MSRICAITTTFISPTPISIRKPISSPPNAGAARDAVVRGLLIVRNTFFGRIVLGPWFSIVETLVSAITQIARGNVRIAGAWALHLVLLGLLATWLHRRCGISPAVSVRRGLSGARVECDPVVPGTSRS